jgi:hypothetical protein
LIRFEVLLIEIVDRGAIEVLFRWYGKKREKEKLQTEARGRYLFNDLTPGSSAEEERCWCCW